VCSLSCESTLQSGKQSKKVSPLLIPSHYLRRPPLALGRTEGEFAYVVFYPAVPLNQLPQRPIIRLGDIVLLTGGNGSGKSTVLKTIHGLLTPWTPEGKIIFDDHDLTAPPHTPVSARIRHGIVYMPQKKKVFEDFTVEENLLTSAATYPKPQARQRVDRLYEMLPLLATMRLARPNRKGPDRMLKVSHITTDLQGLK